MFVKYYAGTSFYKFNLQVKGLIVILSRLHACSWGIKSLKTATTVQQFFYFFIGVELCVNS